MKRVKCYGKKETRLVETSTTKAFFDDYDQPEKLCSSDTEEGYNLRSSQKNRSPRSLFTSYSRTPKKDDSIQVNKAMKRKPQVKLKKRKGKRKEKRTVNKSTVQKKRSMLRVNKERWSSIYQHGLVIENNGTEKPNVNDASYEEYVESSDIEIFPPKKRVRTPYLYHNLSREAKPFELKEARIVLTKLKVDPNTAKIVSPIDCIKSPKHSSSSILIGHKIAKSSHPKKAPLNMRSLRILLHKLNIGPERGGVSTPVKNIGPIHPSRSSQKNRSLRSLFTSYSRTPKKDDSIQVNKAMKRKPQVKLKKYKRKRKEKRTVNKSTVQKKRSMLRVNKERWSSIYQDGLIIENNGTEKPNVNDASYEEHVESSDIEILPPKKRVRTPYLYHNLSRDAKPFKLKDVRVLLTKLKVDPNTAKIISPIDCIKSPKHSSSSALIGHKIAKRSLPKQAPLNMRSLRILLQKLNIGPQRGGISWWIPITPVRNIGPKRDGISWWIPATPVSHFKKLPAFKTPSSAQFTPINTPSLVKVPPKMKSLRIRLKKLEIDNKNANLVSVPVTPKCFRQSARPMSLFQNYESIDSSMNTNDPSEQYCVPLTSTPIVPSKKLQLELIKTLNLSAITTKPLRGTSKQDLAFEYSYFSKVPTPVVTVRRSLNPAKMKSSGLESSIKVRTEVNRSIYLQTSTKEVSVNDAVLPKLLKLCNQTELIGFQNLFEWRKLIAQKVGEGSYGEVFALTSRMETFIIKVIPVSEDLPSDFQSLSGIYSEVKVSQCLSDLRTNKENNTKNFSFLRGVHLVRGRYHPDLLRAWDDYTAEKDTYNIRPDYFDENALFAIIELEHGGEDLSSFKLRNASEAVIVFQQVALSLAIAEEVHLFEHRDLHLGNILVQRKYNSKSVPYIFRGKNISIKNEGLLVTIIDFTLSRILDCGIIYFNDLADDLCLFDQTGDLQFQVYKATKKQLNNQWRECLLFSNVLWLNYLCQKFLELGYSIPSSIKQKKGIKTLNEYLEEMTQCKSALECLKACDFIKIPDKIVNKLPMQSSNAKYVDRNSLLKGKTSVLSNYKGN